MDKLDNRKKVIEYKSEEELVDMEYYKLFATSKNVNKRTFSKGLLSVT